VVGIDFVSVSDACRFRREVRDDLMSEKIKVYPFGRASAFFATENFAIKTARFLQVFYGKRQVK
jgi:hypothetical protein